MSFRSIAIVGSGAIGSCYGAYLQEAGHDVRFLMRSDLETVRKQGLKLKSPKRSFELDQVKAFGTSKAIGPVDLVVIAIKATANEALRELIPPLLHEGTVLLTMQNGLGNEAFLAEQFGESRVLGCLCFTCMNRVEPGVLVNSYPGYIAIGEMRGGVSNRLRALGALFESAGVRVQITENLKEERWKKLIWNVPFNGLAIAGGGIDCEQILASEGLTAEVKELMCEVQEGAKANGVDIPDAFLDKNVEVTYPMGPYQPSSVIDYNAGKPVEVEAIWGEAVRKSQEAGAEVPRLELLYHLLKVLAKSS